MKTIQRVITNICSSHLSESKDFYMTLFDFKINYESDWFIHLVSKNKAFELGIIDNDHDIIPKVFQKVPTGLYITFVVDHVDHIYHIAKKEEFEIISPPTDTFYGQRRLLLKDPNGALVDISSPISRLDY